MILKIGNMDNKFTEESLTHFFNKRNNIRKEYDTKITSISNKFFADNNLPFRVGDRVMVVNGKVGTIVSLHAEPCKYIRYYKCIPMIKVELDENKELEYFAAITNIRKI